MERSQGRRGPLKGFTRRLSGLLIPGHAAEEISKREEQRNSIKKRMVEHRDKKLSVVKQQEIRPAKAAKLRAKRRAKAKGIVRKNKTKRQRHLMMERKRRGGAKIK